MSSNCWKSFKRDFALLNLKGSFFGMEINKGICLVPTSHTKKSRLDLSGQQSTLRNHQSALRNHINIWVTLLWFQVCQFWNITCLIKTAKMLPMDMLITFTASLFSHRNPSLSWNAAPIRLSPKLAI